MRSSSISAGSPVMARPSVIMQLPPPSIIAKEWQGAVRQTVIKRTPGQPPYQDPLWANQLLDGQALHASEPVLLCGQAPVASEPLHSHGQAPVASEPLHSHGQALQASAPVHAHGQALEASAPVHAHGQALEASAPVLACGQALLAASVPAPPPQRQDPHWAPPLHQDLCWTSQLHQVPQQASLHQVPQQASLPQDLQQAPHHHQHPHWPSHPQPVRSRKLQMLYDRFDDICRQVFSGIAMENKASSAPTIHSMEDKWVPIYTKDKWVPIYTKDKWVPIYTKDKVVPIYTKDKLVPIYTKDKLVPIYTKEGKSVPVNTGHQDVPVSRSGLKSQSRPSASLNKQMKATFFMNICVPFDRGKTFLYILLC